MARVHTTNWKGKHKRKALAEKMIVTVTEKEQKAVWRRPQMSRYVSALYFDVVKT